MESKLPPRADAPGRAHPRPLHDLEHADPLAQCEALIRDACRIDPLHRPLIIAGGPKTIYEPWDVFSSDPLDPWGADVAVTGEEYVLLSLLEVLLSIRANNESLRTTFMRARNSGILDAIPGLVYARTDREGVAEELIDTGIQRLLGDLDELPHSALGYQLLEPPSRRATLAAQPLTAREVRRYTPIVSLVLTLGCKFNCPYCPIPAYNQRQYRVKSGQRIATEMARLGREYGLRYFFGADDNFFNNEERTLEILETLAHTEIDGAPVRKRIRWGTEVTIHDTLKLKEHLSLARHAGIRALWLGVEDMTATLVKKGQSVDKTTEAFGLLQQYGISPMPMMMHHDTQPLVTRGTETLRIAQPGSAVAEGRGDQPASPDDHARNRFEAVRRGVYIGSGVRERRWPTGRAAHDGRQLRRRFRAQTALEETAQYHGGVLVLLQSATLPARVGASQEQALLRRRPHATGGHARPGTDDPPNAGLGCPLDAWQYPPKNSSTRQPDPNAQRGRSAGQPCAAEHTANQVHSVERETLGGDTCRLIRGQVASGSLPAGASPSRIALVGWPTRPRKRKAEKK